MLTNGEIVRATSLRYGRLRTEDSRARQEANASTESARQSTHRADAWPAFPAGSTRAQLGSRATFLAGIADEFGLCASDSFSFRWISPSRQLVLGGRVSAGGSRACQAYVSLGAPYLSIRLVIRMSRRKHALPRQMAFESLEPRRLLANDVFAVPPRAGRIFSAGNCG
jgi:hypothetical protein